MRSACDGRWFGARPLDLSPAASLQNLNSASYPTQDTTLLESLSAVNRNLPKPVALPTFYALPEHPIGTGDSKKSRFKATSELEVWVLRVRR